MPKEYEIITIPSRESISGLKEIKFKNSKYDFSVYYDRTEKPAFVIDRTCDVIAPNHIVIVNPEENEQNILNPEVKWDVILEQRYKVVLENIRPKEDNKYQKLDPEYEGLAQYAAVIEDPENTQRYIALETLREKKALENALKREEEELLELNRSSHTLETSKNTLSNVEQTFSNLDERLKNYKEIEKNNPEQLDTEKKARAEESFEKYKEKLKRTKRRLRRAEKRYERAQEELENIRNLIKEIKRRMELRGKTPAKVISIDDTTNKSDIKIENNNKVSPSEKEKIDKIMAMINRNVSQPMQTKKETKSEEREEKKIQPAQATTSPANNATTQKQPYIEKDYKPQLAGNYNKKEEKKEEDSFNKKGYFWILAAILLLILLAAASYFIAKQLNKDSTKHPEQVIEEVTEKPEQEMPAEQPQDANISDETTSDIEDDAPQIVEPEQIEEQNVIEEEPKTIAEPAMQPQETQKINRLGQTIDNEETEILPDDDELTRTRKEYLKYVIGNYNSPFYRNILQNFENVFFEESKNRENTWNVIITMNAKWNRFRNASYKYYYKKSYVLKTAVENNKSLLKQFYKDEEYMKEYILPYEQKFNMISNNFCKEYANEKATLCEKARIQKHKRGYPQKKARIIDEMYNFLKQNNKLSENINIENEYASDVLNYFEGMIAPLGNDSNNVQNNEVNEQPATIYENKISDNELINPEQPQINPQANNLPSETEEQNSEMLLLPPPTEQQQISEQEMEEEQRPPAPVVIEDNNNEVIPAEINYSNINPASNKNTAAINQEEIDLERIDYLDDMVDDLGTK